MKFLREVDPGEGGRVVFEHAGFIGRYPIVIERLAKEPSSEGDNSIVDLKFSVRHEEAVLAKEEYRALLGDPFGFVVSYSEVGGRAGYKINEYTRGGRTTVEPAIMEFGYHAWITTDVHRTFSILGKKMGLDMAHEISEFR